jgi:hypothetical protein
VLFDVACDASSNVYVSDAYGNRVQKFTSDGTFVTAWGSSGSGPGQFSYSEGIEVDGAGNVYVVDAGNSRVQKFTSDGTYLTEWGGYGSGNGQFSNPTYIGIDATSNLFVADNGNYRIQKFGQQSVAMAVTLPGALNLRSLGRWMTAYLQPPAELAASAIDVGSIRFHGNVAGSSPVLVDAEAPSEIGDNDGDGVRDLMVKFPRDAVRQTLTEGAAIPVTVTGTVAGRPFTGATTLRVLHAPVTSPTAGAVLAPGTRATVRWETPLTIAIQSVALLSSMDDGWSWTLVATGLPSTGYYEWAVPPVSSDRVRVAVVLVESADPTGYVVQGELSTSERFKIAGQVGVGDPGDVAFALDGVTPNPGRGTLFAKFSLPDASPARLEVLDLGGRQVMAREVGQLGQGHHLVPLTGGWPAGVYWVRLARGAQVRTTRVAILD